MQLPQIRETKCFLASDNTTHPDRKSAQIHECGLNLLAKLIDKNEKNDGQLKRVCMIIAKEFELFGDTFTAIRRINTR